MANVLYLTHRLPYPPNKGDKVRSYHLLKHLASDHRVFLGTFIDDPEDRIHLATVRELCADLHVARLSPLLARCRSLAGLVSGEALTLPYFRDDGLRAWVAQTRHDVAIDRVVVFSSAMAQYVEPIDESVLIDFVDVDSAKWSQYADGHRRPMSWLYRREGRRLLAYERHVAARARRSFFVTENEANLFRGLAPECADRVEVMPNGVDAEYFSPDHAFDSPFAAGELAVVFTGAMDYWPNVDAARWFAAEVLPGLRVAWPLIRFHIVGRSPAASIRALASAEINVTGTVPDVRPYLGHAAVVVAPLRLARGIQNKILEAMASAKAVVASESCASVLEAKPGRDFLTAGTADEFTRQIDTLLREPARAAAIGVAARNAVVAHYSWTAHLADFDRYLSIGDSASRQLAPRLAGNGKTHEGVGNGLDSTREAA